MFCQRREAQFQSINGIVSNGPTRAALKVGISPLRVPAHVLTHPLGDLAAQKSITSSCTLSSQFSWSHHGRCSALGIDVLHQTIGPHHCDRTTAVTGLGDVHQAAGSMAGEVQQLTAWLATGGETISDLMIGHSSH